jgi:toxin secretion/phage lysis holin
VWVAAAMDRYLGINFARAAVILFFIGNEGLSLLENMGLMGVPYPQKFKNALEALKKQGDEGTVTHNG